MVGFRRALVACVLALGIIPNLSAQTTTGRIAGVVSDASGAVLPGVTVTATETSTGISRSTTTDAQGSYAFTNLQRGNYTVTAELTGFKKSVRANNELVADGRIGLNFSLEVGAMTETLEVVAAGEAVNALSGEIARTVDRDTVQNMALNGRNYMQLATLIPGTPLLELNALDIMTGLSINTSVNGSRNNASLLMVDGGFNMDSGSNNSQISNVGIDFIEEVNIKTANFSAEYGRNSGAAINVVTRSGGNEVHGSLFEYRRDEKLDANDTFANRRNIERAPLDYNNFGWSLGGPIRKGKLFFFAGQEWKQIDRLTSPPQGGGKTLPTRAMRNGDFSGLAPIRDPLTGQPFPGNMIPAGRITADGRAIANVYTAMEQKAASYTDTPTANNAFFQDENPFRFRQDLIRLDFQASEKHRLTLRVIHDNYDLEFPYGTFIDSHLPTIPTNRRRPGRNYQVTHSWTVKPSVINEFKAGASWNSQRIPPVGDAWQRETYGFQFPHIYQGGGRFENSIPDTTIQNYAPFNGAARSLISPTTDISVSDNVTYIKGAHTIKAGGLYIRNRKDQNGRSVYAGRLDFATTSTQTTGNAFADALLGNFRTYSEAQSDPMGFFRFSQIEGFVSDNWRISRTLSVEAGFRYTWHSPTHSQMNNMASFVPDRYDPARAVTMNRNGTIVPGTGDRYNGMVRAGDGVPPEELIRVPGGDSDLVKSVPAGAPRGFYPDRHVFGPRFSFAWSQDEKMAIRGGVGLFFDRPEGNVLFGGNANGPINNPPYNLSAQYENGNLTAPGGGATPAVTALAGISAIHPDLEPPATWNYSVSVQRELVSGIFGEISYVGSRGRNLLRNPDINQASFEDLGANAALQPASARANTNFLRPYKGYSNIFMVQSDGESAYNSLQLFLSKRRGSLRWTFSYTLGRSTDDGSANLGTDANLEDFTSKDFNDGPSNFDRTHVVVGTWTYQLPFLQNNKGMAGRLLGGWEISGIGRYQTGEPMTITANTTIGERRADIVEGIDPYYSDAERIAENGDVRWLRKEAFAPAPEGRRGNSKRGAYRGPDFSVFDISLRKQFSVTDRVKLGFQADLFNALNKVNYRLPARVQTTGGFGTITQAAPSRNVQLGLRLTF